MPYAYDEIEDLCPWCNADGSAHEKLDAEFASDFDQEIPADREAAITYRTPSFASWQQEIWLTHCDDAARFLGSRSWEELKDLPGIPEQLRANGLPDSVLEQIHPDGMICAYLFECLHCQQKLVYTDSS